MTLCTEKDAGFFLSPTKPKQIEIPEHIAVVMDGNRRWSLENNLPILEGYRKGIESLIKITEAASDIGVQTLTVYAFSTENWTRSEEEVGFIFSLMEKALYQNKSRLRRGGISLKTIGNLAKLPSSLQTALQDVKEATSDNQKLQLVLAINYGGRDEILRSVKKLLQDFEKNLLKKDQIDEELFSSYLDTSSFKDPDLLIRTSGEQRISNFLLWQISYSEIYITDTTWPDFAKEDLWKAVLDYQARQRRLGGS